MNLAWADVRHHLFRFWITSIAVSALLCGTIGMVGFYRGIIYEAMLIINNADADLWVIQGDRVGPFAEASEVPGNLDHRIEGVPGVRHVRRFIQYNQQFNVDGRHLRIAIVGLDFPKDNGSWIPLVSGRYLYTSHYEAIADQSLGFLVGDKVRLGHDVYTIVGLTRGQVDMGGDGMLFVTIPDSQLLSSFAPSEAVLLYRVSKTDSSPVGYAKGRVAAVMVTLQPGIDSQQVKSFIRRWGDVNVLNHDEEEHVLLEGRLNRLRLQIIAFVMMTFAVTTLVIALSIYTVTLEKTHQIAMLKLLGARDRMIIGMIVQQSLLVGISAFILGTILAHLIYPHFPRTVLIYADDVVAQGILTVFLCIAASWFGIRTALGVRAQEVLS